MTHAQPRSGYTLPVFACAAAIAAFKHLRSQNYQSLNTVELNLIEPNQIVEISIEQVATLQPNIALAITRSDPGDNLDLTRHTPIWAKVELSDNFDCNSNHNEKISLVGGEGIGYQKQTGDAAIYTYARRLFQENLAPLLQPTEKIQITIILPEGRQLAKRTSNEAFGVVEGLSLLGTTGISQPLSAPGQLEAFIEELQQKASQYKSLVFCVGENGLDLAQKLGISSQQTVKTANWIGPMLAASGLAGVESILLFGYHGKLIKLAGGIFHTHHHLADARLEILTAHCAKLGLPTENLRTVFDCETTEVALNFLRTLDQSSESQNVSWVKQIYGSIASKIDQKSQTYIRDRTQHQVQVGSILFDRQRKIVIKSAAGDTLLSKICYSSVNNHLL
ncbi:MAG: cobalt-precorrin-5B (C(1))-methyltransferase CbiD [Cyanobacteriota bacterium]|nr:cobalt-precorrin-5B (C(1))-methyltransferase CbiD [Cyanobacteriota bacterium]